MASDLTGRAADHWMELFAGGHEASTVEELERVFFRRPMCSVLRPVFLEASACQAAMRAAEAVYRGIHVAGQRLLADESLRRSIAFPRYLDRLLDLDRAVQKPSLLARIDGLVDAAGKLSFIEYNASPGGMVEGFEISRAFARMPIARELGRRFPFTPLDARDCVVDALVEETRGREGAPPPALAVLTMPSNTADTPSRDGPVGLRDLEHWVLYAASRGCRVVEVDATRLEVRGDGVFVDDTRIDTVLTDFNVFFRPAEALRPLLRAFETGLVSSFFGLSHGLVCSNKLTFELLSDPLHAGMFDRETLDALRQHVPWTRSVRECKTSFRGQTVDLLPFIAQHREDFVLKPAGGKGGEGVLLGWACDSARWEATLRHAVKQPFVVQERIDAETQPFPALVDGKVVVESRSPDFNPFLQNGGRAESFIVRVGRMNNTHNYAGGGSLAPVFVLEG